ncbi:MAG: IclR family transcriptional regulator, partial [Micrococcales bacterium]|nr:IclR family transcriptional regulator [Micrococcales bacterium]
MSKIPAAERTLRLLMAMAEIGQPVSAGRLAQKLG